MKIAFIGSGNVGAALADQLQRKGHDVTLGESRPGAESARKAVARNTGLKIGPLRDAVASAEVVFLAVPYAANAEILPTLGEELRGKVLVDCTNPVGAGLSHGLKSVGSGAEEVQKYVPQAKVVKAFSIYGFENFENSAYPNYSVKPAMLYCGNDSEGKGIAAKLMGDLGWEPVDVGGLEQALHLEHMTLLWIRMVRAKGGSPNLVWAALRR